MSPSITPRPFYVPTIDLSQYLKDPSCSEAEKVIEDIREACLSTGFFLLTNHGVEKSVQQDVFDAAEKFFQLPFEHKKALDAKAHAGHRGYDVLASQSYEEGVMPDLKEVKDFFCFSPFFHPFISRKDIPSEKKKAEFEGFGSKNSPPSNKRRHSRVSTSALTSPPTTHVPSPAASSWVPTSGQQKNSSPPRNSASRANATIKLLPA